MSLTPTFQGEVQMRRWSDSSTQGVQVTFALPDASDLEPLKAKTGKRFMAVLVEIGDDEQPVQPPVQRGPLCIEACEYSRDPAFWKWAGVTDENAAAEWIKRRCQVDSRKEIDHLRYAADLFRNDVRVPFMRWQRQQRGGR
jgi:hypothetical protein